MKVFRKERYLMTIDLDEYGKDDAYWVNKLDGKAVEKFFHDGDGMIGDYFIALEWMEEVQSCSPAWHELDRMSKDPA